MGILTETEKERLMMVPTTVEEAQQILERNQTLLAHLNKGKRRSISIKKGCPHCTDPHPCFECAWVIGDTSGSMPCFSATFGGLTMRDLTLLRYWDDSADLDFRLLRENLFTEEQIQEELRNTRTFIEGHIEWAMMVIAAGGIPWPEGVEHG